MIRSRRGHRSGWGASAFFRDFPARQAQGGGHIRFFFEGIARREVAPIFREQNRRTKMADETMNQGGSMTGTTGATGAGAQNKIESSKTHARRAAEDLKSAATSMAEDYRDKATQVWDDAKVRARTLQEDGEDYVRENPMKAVATALGIGFVLGLIFRR
jgi:ElaB/YqjD/DUF883 family membrane-anchored ribosome-binding protein